MGEVISLADWRARLRLGPLTPADRAFLARQPVALIASGGPPTFHLGPVTVANESELVWPADGDHGADVVDIVFVNQFGPARELRVHGTATTGGGQCRVMVAGVVSRG